MSQPVSARASWKLIDWRLVAACGLPLWAFLFGMLLGPRPVRVAQASPPVELPAIHPAGPDTLEAPMPREIVIREVEPRVITVPVAIPIPEEPVVVPAENQLPASELIPADRCKTFNTTIRFHPTLADAADEARKSRKLIFVLHISGDFDDPGFT